MLKKTYYLVILLIFSINVLSAQRNVIEKSEYQIKMFNAQQNYFSGDYQRALNTYKDLLIGDPSDANLLGRMAECYFNLKQYDEAEKAAEKAKSIDVKAYENTALILGKLYHMNEKLDEALVEYNAYKQLLGSSKKAKESHIDQYIEQVNTAKALMAAPAPVKILNMGTVINSKYDDKAPMVTADGQTIIFTSRRPGKTDAIDTDGDNRHFEDIYISKWDTLKRAWLDAELIPGSVNTEGHDAATSISPDGKQIFIYKNDINGESRGGDIYVSRLSSSGKWGSPKSIGKPINTSYWEGGACISPDGKTLYLISERSGGLGFGDIYVSKRKTRTEWDTPVSIGSNINTSEDEGGLFLAPDGKTLFFSSKGHNSMGGYDIFKTVFENNKWSDPINIGYPINSVNNDVCFSLSANAKTGYFNSDRPGGLGERDIYQVDLSKYLVLEKEMIPKPDNNTVAMAILKGDIFDATEGKGIEAEVLIFDEAGEKVASTTSADSNGEYFITLPADKIYQVKINLKHYKPIEEKVDLKINSESTTTTVVKHFLLYEE